MKINHWVIFDSILFFLLNLFILPIHSQIIKLDEAKFRNGDKLLFCSSDSQWLKANQNSQPAYRVDRLGNKLYNGYAISDKRIIAPKGYHIPTRVDFTNQKSSKDFDCNIDYIAKTYNCELLYYNSTSEVRNDKSLMFWTADEENNFDAYLAKRQCEYSNKYKRDKISSIIVVARKYLGCYALLFQGESSSYQTESINEIIIGTQIWTTKNLDVSTYRNGQPIRQARTTKEWLDAINKKIGAWCYYKNDPKNGKMYGKLYNWYAVNDKRGLAREGYHIPSDAEWSVLTEYLGGEQIAGFKMKSTTGWANNRNGDNSSGFNALPGGARQDFGGFDAITDFGCWWSSSEADTFYAWVRYLTAWSTNPKYGWEVHMSNDSKNNGFSVRCLRD
jgi:uncharacterized protein (TIGR02145 family)